MCIDGSNHKLIDIYRVSVGWNEEHVVRWCEDCGAVVVDIESDNRRFGSIAPMKFPGMFKKILKMKKEQIHDD